MRVGIDATSWSDRRGYGRFTRGLLEALLVADSEHELLFFVDRQTHEHSALPTGGSWVVVPTGASPTEAAAHSSRRSVGDLWAMATAVRRARPDILFFPTVYTFFPVLTGATVIVGVHDVIPEDYPRLVFPALPGRFFWRLKTRLAHLQADHILTVSHHARRGILRHYGHPPERVHVVDEAADPIFRPLPPADIDAAVLARQGLAPGERFVVYLGGMNPHKNLASLVAAVAAVRARPGLEDLQLLLVGEVEKERFSPGVEAVRAQITAHHLASAVRFTGFVSDADTVHLLNAAQALILPSFAEGFGLPAVEAAACGTPVIATRNSPLPELLAGGGLFIDPHQPQELTAALAQLLGDEAQRSEMGRTALARARALSWQRSAQQLLALLATCC